MGSLPESLRLYILCKHMKWAHLPVGGGLYDQHPKLLDDWLIIMKVDAEQQDRKMREEERKNKASAPGGRPSGRRRR